MGTQYADRFVQQYCSKGKISVEVIKDLHIYVRELLHEFSHLSNKLVFYRAGVDDGSFQKVLDNEVRAIQRACKGNKDHYINSFNKSKLTVLNKNFRVIMNYQKFVLQLLKNITILGFLLGINNQIKHIIFNQARLLIQILFHRMDLIVILILRCTKAVSVPAPVRYATLCVSRGLNLDYEGQMSNEQQEFHFSSHVGEELLDDVQTIKINFNPFN
ncbi:unnamed protein product [Rotaria magnacalcarata]|uniref:Piwi domain-containing protein n=1 Tax=Rotaria magnacalcarata TaxID=392030 RepID=A0A816QGB3_9BILA|nr:unnamed protein product [Rotaria magnacalcarata]